MGDGLSLQQAQKRTRQDNILTAIRAKPLTLQQIAELTGTSYHTARNDIRDLIKAGMASPTGQMTESGATYRAGHSRPMPMVYHKSSDQHYPISLLAESFAKNPGKTSSSEAALEVMRIASELMYLVALSEVKGHPNHVRITNNVVSVSNLRKRMANALLHLETVTGIAEQMLNDERLWSVKDLDAITSDTLFNPEKSILVHETIISQE